MSTDRRRMLEALLRKEGLSPATSAPGIPRRPWGEPAAPSVGEAQLVAWSALFPHSPAYHLPYVIEAGEILDRDRLEAAFALLLDRHPALRAGYRLDPGGSVTKNVAGRLSFTLAESDLSAATPDAAAASVAALEKEDARRPFDLGTPPLLRARRVLLPGERSALVVVLHHLVADGWSLGIFWRELEAAYRGHGPTLPALPIGHDDWAAWQRSQSESDETRGRLEWWRRQLADAPWLELPMRRPRRGPAPESRPGARLPLLVAPETASRLLAIGRAAGASPFVTLAALWAALLARRSGTADLVIGTAAAHRDLPETRGLVGFFADVLPLRIDLGGAPAFREVLARVQDALRESFARALPFETLVAALEPPREAGRTPFFSTLVTLEGEDAPASGAFRARPIDLETAKFDLSLDLHLAGGAIAGHLEYDRDLYSAPAARRLVRHFAQLAEEVVRHAERPLHDLSLVSAEELEQLERQKATAADYPRGATVDRLFAAVAAESPAAIALRCEGRELTYAELDAAANRLAHHLRSRGAGPETAVAICLERSLELIVATLAVVKAGGFYVPLDRAYPAERRALLLADSGARILVTAAGLGEEWPCDLELIELDRDAAQVAAWPPTAPPPRTWPESLLYVMFTSGSTGRPKGVTCSHRNAIRLVRGNSFARLERRIFLQLAPTSFDAATLEIWGPLLGGGRLAIYPAGPIEPAGIGRFLAEEKVQIAWLTAGLFHRMVDEELPALLGLEQLLAGGDVLSPRHVETFLQQAGDDGCVLINGYGPTENTTFTACHAMRGSRDFERPVPIGKPISNTTVWLLDREMRPAPVGTIGELYTGGDGLSRGYVGRPALTADKFVPDPRGNGDRLYRSGDLAFWTEEDVLSFIGRADQQVKIRGFRIEPGEIEAQLAALPGVLAAAVVVRDHGGEKRLAGYAVAADGAGGPAEWRAALAARLPSHMVPADLVRLESLPLTENGKLDRRALPDPAAPTQDAAAPPDTPTEIAVAEIWEQVLGRTGIGREDDFFLLGGHSLSLTQVAARLRERLGRELPLPLFFANLELAALAAAIDTLASPQPPDAVAEASGAAAGEKAAAAEGAGVALPPILPTGEKNPPLSFAQERLYFFDRFDPGNVAYNVPLALDLAGPLDREALHRALDQLVARHDALRTRFVHVDGAPRQEVLPPFSPELPFFDLAGEPAEQRENAARERELAYARRVFDLAAGPLFAAALLRLGPLDHRLLLVQHHAITDGWSADLLVDELCRAYAAFAAGKPFAAPAPLAQYPDYAVWQRSWLAGAELERQLSYWRQALNGVEPLDLPADRPRPGVRRFAGGEIELPLAPGELAALEELARRHGATLFTVLVAGLRAYLWRISGAADFAIGAAVANRRLAALETMAGFCVNALALRTPVAIGHSFAALLAAEQRTALAAWAHQDLPFERLVEALSPARDTSRSPIFQVVATQRREPPAHEVGSLRVAVREIYNGSSKFDLAVGLLTGGALPRLALEYDRDLFDEATAATYLSGLRTLLAAAAADPGKALADLPLTADIAPLLAPPRPTAGRGEGTLHGTFFARAAAHPETTALVFGEERISYGELAARARLVAAALAGAGAGPELAIGLCLERSAELVAGALGVLAAGAAYLPLDPAAPAGRLAYILADAAVPLLLTHSSLRGRLPAEYPGLVLAIDELEAAAGGGMPPADRPMPAGADHLAYVIYTSGSTGQPKGSPITHRNALRLFETVGEVFEFRSSDVWTQFHSFAFDFSVWEMWGAFLHGGRLVVVPAETSRSPEDYCRLLAREGVTLLNQTPSAFGHLLATDAELYGTSDGSAFATVRTVFLGGEAIDLAALRPFFDRFGDRARVFNLYGPTETTVAATIREIRRGDLATPGRSPLGASLNDSGIVLLDRFGQLVPNGVPGEIGVVGAGLGRGYLRRPRLTAEKFVPHPFALEPGERLYRTGDLAKRTCDGDLLYLGRIDHQIKLRGFRIELGEIEAQLASHPEVREAAVLLRGDGGEPRLVAYLIPRLTESGGRLEPSELRTHLGRTLPEYMVPQSFVALESFPLNVNGKLDRAALPAPVQEAAGRTKREKTPAEELVAGIWSEVLGVGPIEHDDDFFALGGHSLKAARVISRLREKLGCELPLRTLFTASRLDALAAAIAPGDAGRAPLPPLVAEPNGEAVLSFAQERMYFLDRLDPGSGAYLIPLVLRFGRGLDEAALERALALVVDRHSVLRTTVADGAAGLAPRVAPPASSALEKVGLEASAADAAIARAARRPLDPGAEPPLRATLFTLPDGGTRLLLVLHHIAADIGSLAILLRELGEAYAAALGGQTWTPAAAAIEYADYARWQRRLLAGGEGERQLAYWRRQLADLPPLELPLDRPRPAVQGHRGGRVELFLDAEQRQVIERLAPRAGATPYLILLAGFAALLGRLAGQRDFTIGTPVAGRGQTVLEPLIGLFQNTLALRADLKGTPTFADLVARLRDTLLAAWAHQDIPFERLVDALAPARDLGSTPFFQVLFSFQNETPGAGFEGLEATLEPLDNGASKVDLALLMGPQGDGFAGVLTYDADLFEAGTAHDLAAAFKALLATAVMAPETPVAALPLVAAAAEARIAAFSDTARPVEMATVPQLLARRLAEDPQGQALVAGGVRLDRRGLMDGARRLAHELRARGVGPESIVGLCLPRRAELVVALVAILEAGGAYLPLDPEHPPARRRQLLAAAGARVLVATAELAEGCGEGVELVLVDRDAAAIAARPATAVESSLLPENLAYVLFTSGSTGEPKAVAVEHHRLVNYLAGAEKRLAPEPGWSFGMVSTIAADVGHTALFGSLCWGGTLHLIDRATALDPEAFAEYRRQHRLDLLKIAPSHLEALLAGRRPAQALPERCLVLGGESPRPALLAQIAALRPGLAVFNSYGPTETTAAVATRRVEGLPRLGAPMDNLRFEVVDDELGRLPAGLAGELLIGGRGVARGYLGKPALTAERFLPDPFSGESGARLYRTGDRVRRLPEGELVYLGRRDHQVKIRGYRVELGEVESRLRQLPGVTAAMAAISGEGDEARLFAAAAVGDRAGEPGLAELLRTRLRGLLPEPMVPARLLLLEALPLNANGKVDRPALARRLRDEASSAGAAAAVAPPESPEASRRPFDTLPSRRPLGRLATEIATLWQRLLDLPQVGLDDNFFDLGGHSLLLVRLQRMLREELGREVAVVDLFTHPTVASLVRHLEPAVETAAAAAPTKTPVPAADRRIAVVGMSGRFPGAGDLETFWQNLAAGVESIRGFDAEERRRSGADPALFENPDYVDARGVLDGVEDFDAALFGFRPQEAALTDPQQRVFLECVWEAFEDAGLDPARAPGPVGVFAGSSQSTYFLNHVFANTSLGDLVWALETRIGNDKDFLPTRVAYKFDLEGPAVAVQTSCSTSLVAVHMACASLLDGGCDVAVAGGVRISFPQQAGYLYQAGGVASPDGHCRAFSADARGTVPGNGCGVVLLKRLADAEAAGDRIQAVILGSAINNDGARKVGYTAPSPIGQRRVIGAALAAAGVAAGEIDYVETHGTGTVLGDPIEIAALRAEFGSEPREEPCLLGALKTNIGHLDAAAGVAGLIKTVLSLQHGTIPPTLHFREANPQLELERSPFAVAGRATPWPRRDERPRRAGVSSFGIGGTNVHLVLEEAKAEAPVSVPAGAGAVPRLLLLSAHDRPALDELGERLATHLAGAGRDLDLGDVAFTLATGRRRLEQRRCVVARSAGEAALALRSPERRTSGQAKGEHQRALYLLFPGQGSQHPGMGRQLYANEPVFRAAIDRGAEWLLKHRGLDLRPLLFPAAGAATDTAAERLASTEVTQPALFVFEFALAELFRSLGFEPAAMLGHSVGEYVAATVSGVFSYEAGLELVAERGRLISELPGGAMAAVELPAAALAARLPAELSIAAENAPESTVLSGPPAILDAFCEVLRAEGAEPRALKVSHAFHSAAMDEILDRFRELVAAASPQPPRIPFVSNLSGAFVSDAEAVDPGYWARHLRGTVRFAAGAACLLAGEGAVFLELGPGQSLSALLRRQDPAAAAISSLPRASQAGADDREAFLQAVGRLWLNGFEPRVEALFPGRPRRVALPTYPFQRRRFFLEMPAGAFATGAAGERSVPEPLPAVAIADERPAIEADYVAPRNTVEKAMAELWQKTFGIARIGVFDSFFDLGGDSLLAARLSTALRREGYEISMAQLISLGTIAALAPLCGKAPESGEADRLQELVADLDRMSVEELEALLAQDEPINS